MGGLWGETSGVSGMGSEHDRDDLLTLLSVGALAYLTADVAHHLIGHGGACVALGGAVQSITSTRAFCTVTGAAVDVAGPLANLVLGLASLAALRLAGTGPLARLVLIQTAGFNLFWFAAQLVFSAAARTDDWNELLRVSQPPVLWRVAAVLAGVTIYGASLLALRRSASPLGAARTARAMLWAWLAGGAVALTTGLRDPAGGASLVQHALPQALLLPLGLIFLRPPEVSSALPPIARQPWLILAAGAAVVGSILVLGPGLTP